MGYSLNKVQIIGNLTRDPEVRMAGAQKVATFGVATSSSWTDKVSGQKKEKTEFHNVVAWRKLAEICELYLKKGSKVYVEGRLQTRDWQGEDGVKRYKTEILIENMIMLSKKGEFSGGMEAGGSSNAEPNDYGSSFKPVRQQRNVKKASSSDEMEGEGAAAKEEEVSIDDLPF